jgi:FMN reductase
MNMVVFSCSLSPVSRSAVLAGLLGKELEKLGDQVELVDLRELELPFCDAGKCYEHPNVQKVQAILAGADAVVIATPIYNFETGGATRNLIALTGKAWTAKVVGFACAAGGQGSYMAVMSLANSLMLDFRCFVIPRFLYAHGGDFDGSQLTNPDVSRRISELAAELKRVAGALAAKEE